MTQRLEQSTFGPGSARFPIIEGALRKGIGTVLRRDPNRRRSRNGSEAGSSGARSSKKQKTGARGRAQGNGHETQRDSSAGFILYVEGARDQEVLAGWARRGAPELLRCLEQNTVILGGRQPARALTDFEKRGGMQAGLRGLIVLDRDDFESEEPGRENDAQLREAGLELFVWGLRHIESYLLVPAAIQRVLGLDREDARVERALEALHAESGLRSDPERVPRRGQTARSLHAKRILGAGGSLSEALGAPLHAGAIAKAMSGDDMHEDIQTLFARMRALNGLVESGPEVVVRRAPVPSSDPPS